MERSREVALRGGTVRSTGPQLNAWIPYRSPGSGALLRLFCFPHAGGGASTPCAVRMSPGDHFFLETARASVFRTVAHAVLPKMPSGEGGQGADMTPRAGT